MSEQIMQLIRMGLEVLQEKVMMWCTLIFTFILFCIAVNRSEITTIATAVLWACLVYLPMLFRNTGGSGGA